MKTPVKYKILKDNKIIGQFSMIIGPNVVIVKDIEYIDYNYFNIQHLSKDEQCGYLMDYIEDRCNFKDSYANDNKMLEFLGIDNNPFGRLSYAKCIIGLLKYFRSDDDILISPIEDTVYNFNIYDNAFYRTYIVNKLG